MLAALLMSAAALSAAQGTAARLLVPDEPGLAAVAAQWRDQTLPLVHGDGWSVVIGADLDDAPGAQTVPLTFTYADGHTRTGRIELDVESRDYPTTRLTVAPKYVELSEPDQQRAARERAKINTLYATITPERLWAEPFTVPIPGATNGRNFGHRRVFNDQPRAPHSGADLSAAIGTPVHAANRGRVVLAENLFFSGNAVFIDHGLGVYSVYLHLSKIDVEPGQVVGRGEVIGLAGATGRVTGPHLHWGVRVQGARVDPFSLLDLNPTPRGVTP